MSNHKRAKSEKRRPDAGNRPAHRAPRCCVCHDPIGAEQCRLVYPPFGGVSPVHLNYHEDCAPARVKAVATVVVANARKE